VLSFYFVCNANPALQVIETKYEGGTKLSYKGKKYVTVEQHTKCKCDCKVKKEVSTTVTVTSFLLNLFAFIQKFVYSIYPLLTSLLFYLTTL
jgi:hypothetical protein